MKPVFDAGLIRQSRNPKGLIVCTSLIAGLSLSLFAFVVSTLTLGFFFCFCVLRLLLARDVSAPERSVKDLNRYILVNWFTCASFCVVGIWYMEAEMALLSSPGLIEMSSALSKISVLLYGVLFTSPSWLIIPSWLAILSYFMGSLTLRSPSFVFLCGLILGEIVFASLAGRWVRWPPMDMRYLDLFGFAMRSRRAATRVMLVSEEFSRRVSYLLFLSVTC